MPKKIRIGVIFGGRSGEHEVSLVSAESVIKALDKDKYEVIPIGITKSGQWLTSGQPLQRLKSGLAGLLGGQTIITPDATKKELVPMTRHNQPKKIDCLIPMLHGTYGEDGTMQGLLELADLPYVGAGVLASAVGMDKVVQKQLFLQAGLPVVAFEFFLENDLKKNKKPIIEKIGKLGYPVFVKPANLGSSVGISRVNRPTKLWPAIQAAAAYDRKIIVEKAVLKPREIEVAVLGNDQPQASIPGEIISNNEFYDYDAKYIDGQSHAVIPARLPKPFANRIRNIAIRAFQVIDCSGMARVDFLLDQRNKIYLSEVNTIPGFTSISMYPKLWAASGLPYSKLLDRLIGLAIERHQQKEKLQTSYQPKRKWY